MRKQRLQAALPILTPNAQLHLDSRTYFLLRLLRGSDYPPDHSNSLPNLSFARHTSNHLLDGATWHIPQFFCLHNTILYAAHKWTDGRGKIRWWIRKGPNFSRVGVDAISRRHSTLLFLLCLLLDIQETKTKFLHKRYMLVYSTVLWTQSHIAWISTQLQNCVD